MNSGSWGDGGTPQLWNTMPDGSGTFIDGFTSPTAADNIIVQAGHEIELIGFASGTYEINDIKVLQTGKLYTTSTPPNPSFNLNGTSIGINGELDLQHMTLKFVPGVFNFFGDGSIIVNQFQINPNVALTIDTDVHILGDFEVAYLSGFQLLPNVRVESGRTFLVEGDFLVDPDMNISTTNLVYEVRGSFEVAGRLRILGNLDLRSNDVSGMTYQVIVSTGGILSLEGTNSQILGTGTSFPGAAVSALDVSGTLDFKTEHMILDPSTRSLVRMNTDSKCILSGSGNQLLDADVDNATYFDVELTNSNGTISLEGNTIISNELTLTNNSLELGNFNLDMTKVTPNGFFFGDEAIKNYSSTNYIKTNGSGSLILYLTGQGFVPAAQFPVGNASYNPALLLNDIAMNPSPVSDYFSVRVTDQILQDGTSGSSITEDYINCTWFVDELTPGGQIINLQLFWDAANELQGFDRNDCGITHYEAGAWDTDASSGAASGSGPFNRTRSGFSSFSPFSVRTVQALPVEFGSFNGSWINEDQIELVWSTESEFNNDYFEVEYSINGIQFSSIARIKGAGSTSQSSNYLFTHEFPEISKDNYYRIKQVDFDGKSSFSDVIHLRKDVKDLKSFNVFPTVSSGVYQVRSSGITTSDKEVLVLNSGGQIVWKGKMNTGKRNLNLSHLTPGTYFVKLLGLNLTQKIVLR